MDESIRGMKVDHIAIAVRDLGTAIRTYESILGTECRQREVVESEQVETAFLKAGDSHVELIAAFGPESAVIPFLEKRGEGLHHIAFTVDDLEEETQRLVTSGFHILNEPVRGAGGKRIVFLRPSDCHGVLVELCQPI
ncbi:MAG: methylmalonyl-CoA epimerase [Balneolaceae bacterium]